MFDRVSGEVRTILASAEDEARDLGASAVESEHLLLGIMQLDGPLAAMLRGYGLDLESVRRILDDRGVPDQSSAVLREHSADPRAFASRGASS